MPTIVLADGHRLVRQGFKALLEKVNGFTVVGEADDGESALSVIEQLKPHVLVVDLALPGLKGLDVIARIHRYSPQTRAIVLSIYAEEAYVVQALDNGARGYVIKDSQSSDLVLAIYKVLEGGLYLSPPLSESAIETYRQTARCSGNGPSIP